MIDFEFMKKIAAEYGVELTEDQLIKLDKYAQLLALWNEKINLTAITHPQEIAIKHFLDSLLLLRAIDIKENASLIDVGTGAGFPSLPCKIARDDIKLTMLDSLNKRVNFLNEVVTELKLNADSVHFRAEDAGMDCRFREKFDFATARAVAHLRELSEYCLPFVKVGGYFVALKGSDIDIELDEAKTAIKLLGGEIEDVRRFILPDDSKRGIVILKKISHTPPKFPRSFAKMKKQPII